MYLTNIYAHIRFVVVNLTVNLWNVVVRYDNVVLFWRWTTHLRITITLNLTLQITARPMTKTCFERGPFSLTREWWSRKMKLANHEECTVGHFHRQEEAVQDAFFCHVRKQSTIPKLTLCSFDLIFGHLLPLNGNGPKTSRHLLEDELGDSYSNENKQQWSRVKIIHCLPTLEGAFWSDDAGET